MHRAIYRWHMHIHSSSYQAFFMCSDSIVYTLHSVTLLWCWTGLDLPNTIGATRSTALRLWNPMLRHRISACNKRCLLTWNCFIFYQTTASRKATLTTHLNSDSGTVREKNFTLSVFKQKELSSSHQNIFSSYLATFRLFHASYKRKSNLFIIVVEFIQFVVFK
jgi:hypothetical protein